MTTTAQIVETSVTVNNNSPVQDYVHPDDHTQPTYDMTLGSNLSLKIIHRVKLLNDTTAKKYFRYVLHNSKVRYT